MPQLQVVDMSPTASRGSLLGEKLGQALSRNLPTPEQRVQEQRLSQAFEKLKNLNNPDYLTQLETVLPTLMSTPGGSEVAQTLLPLMQTQAQNRSKVEAFKKFTGGNRETQPASEAQPNLINPNATTQQQAPLNVADEMQIEDATDKWRYPQKAKTGKEDFYPQRSAGPKVSPLMSPAELRQFANNMLGKAYEMGNYNLTYDQAYNMGLEENKVRAANNATIENERQARSKASEDMFKQVSAIGENLKLVNTQTDKNVLQKLVNDYKSEGTSAEVWDKIKPIYQDYKRAEAQIANMPDRPGMFEKFWRKMSGTYKDNEEIQRDIQEPLNFYREHGLFDEARELLDSLGMGPEQTEETLFPLDERQKQLLKKFDKNPDWMNIEKEIKNRENYSWFEDYPYQSLPRLDKENFQKFKSDLNNYLKNNKKANLIVTRGYLNRNSLFSWEDINQAIRELEEEGQFVPDYIQSSQMPIIQQAPLPGLAQQFKYIYQGAK